MGKIFISYRRQDSQDMAGRIFDRLRTKFMYKNVLKDIALRAGAGAVNENIRAVIAKCDVLVALIGEHWLEAHDHDGSHPLDGTSDYVRFEIEEATRQGVKVVPVLLHQAVMPSVDNVPTEFRELATINALRIRSDPDFNNDMRRLLGCIQTILTKRERASYNALWSVEQAEKWAREDDRRWLENRETMQIQKPWSIRTLLILAAVAVVVIPLCVWLADLLWRSSTL